MNRNLKKSICFFTFCFFCCSFLLILSCASSPSNKFQRKVQGMPDKDLISYYHGLNDRIKDIDRDIRRGQGQSPTEHERVTSNMPFYFGGDGYDLNEKRKMVLKELNARNLTP